MDNKYLSIDDVLKSYPFRKANLYRLTSQKLIPHYKLGKRLFFLKGDIESFLKKHYKPVAKSDL